MTKFLAVSFLASCALFLALNSNASEQADTTKDRQQIIQLTKNYGDAWNRHDAAGLAANYMENATWVNWFGAIYTGRVDIQSHYQATHSSYFKETQYYTRSIEDISFVKPDVAVAHVRTGLSGDTRYPGQTFEFRRTIVLIKTSAQWLIFAGQNAKLNEGVK